MTLEACGFKGDQKSVQAKIQRRKDVINILFGISILTMVSTQIILYNRYVTAK